MDTPTQPIGRPAAERLTQALAVSWKTWRMYRADHPQTLQVIARAHTLLERLLVEVPVVWMRVDAGRGGALDVHGVALRESWPPARQLRDQLGERGVDAIAFYRGLERAEVQRVVERLALLPEELERRGGAEVVLARTDLTHVRIVVRRAADEAAAVRRTDSWLDQLASLLPDAVPAALPSAPEEELRRDVAGFAHRLVQLLQSHHPAADEPGIERQSGALGELVHGASESLREHPELDDDAVDELLFRILASVPGPVLEALLLHVAPPAPGVDPVLSRLGPERIGVLAGRLYTEVGPQPDQLARLVRPMQDAPDAAAAATQLEAPLRDAGMSSGEYDRFADALTWLRLDGEEKAAELARQSTLRLDDVERVCDVAVWLVTQSDPNAAELIVQRYAADAAGVEDRQAYAAALIRLGDTLADAGASAVLPAVATALVDELGRPDADHGAVGTALGEVVEQLARDDLAGVGRLLQREGARTDRSPVARAALGEAVRGATAAVPVAAAVELALSDDAQAVVAAAEVVRTLGEPAIREVVVRLGAEEDRKRRAQLVALLREVGAPAVPELVRALDDPRWYLVRNAVLLLGEIGAADQLRAVAGAARHEAPRVRRAAAHSVARLGGPHAPELLRALATDPDEGVARAAAAGLGTLGAAGAESLLDLACARAPFDRAAVGLRREAIDVLAQHGVAGAVEPLVELLASRGLIGGTPVELRVAAGTALGRLGGARAVEALSDATRHDRRPAVREACQSALDALSG